MKIKKVLFMKRLRRKQKKENKMYIPPQTGNVSWSHIFMLSQSVIPKIYIPVLLSVLWTVFLKIFYNIYDDHEFIKTMFFPSSLVTYLGLVLSLLLVFRNTSAYDRFWEGRKAWASILTQVRNLSRHLWIGVEIDENDKDQLEQLNLKKGVMRLLVALVISIRHTLRGEYGWDYDDLASLVQHVPRFNSLMSTAPKESLKILPLEIAYHIQGYIYLQKNVPVTIITQIYGSINSIIDNLTACERILLTPIPTIYCVHIKHALIFYILTLPLQIIPTCGWATILIVILTSFTFFGIEAISSEIENPFGCDKNDLKLDEFCQQIQHEINSMMKYFPSAVSVLDWLECEDIDETSGGYVVDMDDTTTDDSSDESNCGVANQQQQQQQTHPNAFSGKTDSNNSSECTLNNSSNNGILSSRSVPISPLTQQNSTVVKDRGHHTLPRGMSKANTTRRTNGRRRNIFDGEGTSGMGDSAAIDDGGANCDIGGE